MDGIAYVLCICRYGRWQTLWESSLVCQSRNQWTHQILPYPSNLNTSSEFGGVGNFFIIYSQFLRYRQYKKGLKSFGKNTGWDVYNDKKDINLISRNYLFLLQVQATMVRLNWITI